MGRWEEAARWGLERLEDPDLLGAASPRAVALLRSAIADAYSGMGHAHEALRLMKASDGTDTPFSRVLDVVIARDQVQLGRLGDACAGLDALRDSAGIVPATWADFLHVWRLRAWAWAGQPERARDSAAAVAAAPALPAIDRVRTLLELDLAALQDPGSSAPAAGSAWAARLAALTPTSLQQAVAAWCHPDEAGDLAAWREQAREQGDDGLGLMVEVAACRVAARGGDAAQARRAGEAALAGLRRITVPGLYRPTLWLSVADDLRQSAPDVAARALRDAADWIGTIARYQLPPAARRAFLERNPVNRRVLQRQAGGGITAT